MTSRDATAARLPLLVVAAALVEGARVLVQQRPIGKAHGGLWEFPGGKVEAGETPVAALHRELREELGIEVKADALAPLAFAGDEVGGRSLVMLLYACRAWTGAPQPLEAPAIRWCAAESLATLPMPPVDIALLAAVRACLAG